LYLEKTFMGDNKFIDEPPIDPLADTNPSLTIQQVRLNQEGTSGWRRMVGILSLLGAAGLTIATTVILMSSGSTALPGVFRVTGNA
jgi:hypothetical protein